MTHPHVTLRQLLLSLFTVDEARIFVSDHYADSKATINWSGSAEGVMANMVDALQRRGAIDGAFFSQLKALRGGRAGDIGKVEMAFSRSSSSAPSEASPIKSSSEAVSSPSSSPHTPATLPATAVANHTKRDSSITWLHISDFHFGQDKVGSESDLLLRRALVRSIKAHREQGWAPDVVFATGDIAQSGQVAQYEQATTFFDDVLRAAGLVQSKDHSGQEQPQCQRPQRRRLFVVPGNHDVDRAEGKYLLRTLRNTEDAVEWFAGKRKHHFDKLTAYAAWFNSYFEGIRALPTTTTCGPVEQHIINGHALAVLPLNSALFCQDDQDHAKLWIGREPLREALDRLAALDAELRIALMHHPLEWLHDAERGHIERALQSHIDVVLNGHLHTTNARNVMTQQGNALHLAAGAAYQTRKYPNRAMYVRVKGNEVNVFPIRYEDDSESWELDTAIYPHKDGYLGTHKLLSGGLRTKLPESSKPNAKTGAKPPAMAALNSYLRSLLAQCDSIRIDGIGAAKRGRAQTNSYPIEELYTPLSVAGGEHRLLAAAMDTGGEHSMLEKDAQGRRAMAGGAEALKSLLPRHERLLIIGAPGAGKTTFLRLIAAMLARDLLAEPCPHGASWRTHYLGLDHEQPARVPVLVRAANLPAWLADGERQRVVSRERLLDELVRGSQERGDGVDRAQWRTLFEQGRVLLLLDGMDEVPDEALRGQLLMILRDAAAEWDKCPMVVTSRPLSLAAIGEMGFARTTIAAFSPKQIDETVSRWVRAVHGVDGGLSLTGEAKAQYTRLMAAVATRSAVRRMATTPVMLTCLCVVDWHERELPKGRAALYAAVVRWLVAARRRQRAKLSYAKAARLDSDDVVQRALMLLAYEMMSALGGRLVVLGFGAAIAALAPMFQRNEALKDLEDAGYAVRQWLVFECMHGGVLEEVGPAQLKFRHLTFQEYLSALRLAHMVDADARWEVVQARLDDNEWRETIELLPGVLHDSGGAEQVDALLGQVMGCCGDLSALDSAARATGLVGRLLSPLDAYGYTAPQALRLRYEGALERTMEMFTRAGAAEVPLQARIAAAEALGRAGDPRITAERFEENLITMPGQEIRLGRYPVTVTEYRAFIDDEGYLHRSLWSEEGFGWLQNLKMRLPEEWDDQQEYGNRPVVGVSWYEAAAYCAWLNTRKTKMTVRLPTSDEHEAAWSNEYPWSNDEPTEDRANFRYENLGSRLRHATPVGCYPLGDSSHGHADLGGNVWEWCLNGPNKGKGVDKGDRWLRGGGWDYPARYLRAAVRSWSWPGHRNINVSFRVAVFPRAH